ncbi:MAG: hypothetical protein PHW34_15215 [Hespellia sp.]|nr:hypothetical protein [Hespellia sp.]
MEDKQKILDLLLPALQETRKLCDLKKLEYDAETEDVIATFENGYQKKANVYYDSGTAMIRDVIDQII